MNITYNIEIFIFKKAIKNRRIQKFKNSSRKIKDVQ